MTRPLCLACLIVLALIGGVGAPAKGAAAEPPDEAARYAYLLGYGGEFLKIDLENGSLAARWRLSWVRGLGDILSGPGRAQKMWAPRAVQYDGRGVVYAVLPAGPPVDDVAAAHFQVVALQLPELQVVATRDLGGDFAEEPVIVLTSDDERLLVSTRPAGGTSGAVVRVLTAPLLEEAGRLAVAAPLSLDAYSAGGGRLVFDRERVLEIREGKLEPVGFELAKILDSQVVKRLEAGMGIPPLQPASAESVLRSGVTGSRAARLLLFYANHPATRGLLLAVEPLKGAVGKVIETPLTNRESVHLMPDGKSILVEVIEARMDESTGRPKAYKTGRLIVYDATSGAQRSEVANEALAGFASHPLCFHPEGKTLLYATGAGVLLVPLNGSGAPVVVAPGAGPADLVSCFIAAR